LFDKQKKQQYELMVITYFIFYCPRCFEPDLGTAIRHKIGVFYLYTMKISEKKNFNRIFNLFLFLIGTGIIFRIPSTWLIVFAHLIFFYNKTVVIKQGLFLRILIVLPLLLGTFVFFNSDSYLDEFKMLEKYASLALFSWFIIGNYHRVLFVKLIEYYAIATTYMLFISFLS
jgi:hypothetical protein